MSSSFAMRAFVKMAVRNTAKSFPKQHLNLIQARTLATTYYTEKHEYVTVEDDGVTATVGITDFAQAALGDIVYVELPEVDDEAEKGESFGSVESVKAASDVYSPVNGEIIECNETIVDDPGLVNSSAEDEGWFIKIKISDIEDVDDLMDAEAYKEHCESEA